MREILGLDKALRSLCGEKVVQDSKRVVLQQTIEGLRKDLECPGTSARVDLIEREIAQVEEQLAATALTPSTYNSGRRSAKFVRRYQAS